ncbi:MAG TPA: alpha/beta hydrolase [Allosphingosinicella sp.]|jgi:pimeloyl-ACP methyl ester carboxylesterase
MKRREFLLSAALLAAGCAAPLGRAEPSFQSDRISVVSEGSGADVVLIPGLGSSREVWRETVAAVPGYRYHLVQLNGFAGHPLAGNSDGPVAAPAAAEIARYIREARLDRPALIGHSMGGTMAMMVAARNPALVSKLMVVDMVPFLGGLFGPPGTTAQSIRPTADGLRAMLAAPQPAEQRRKRIEESIATMIKTQARREAAIGHSLASDQGLGARAMHELITTDLRPELGAIRVPMTVLYVRAPNAPIGEEQMDAYYRASYAGAPQARLKRMPDSYHFIMWDAPAAFAAEVRSFLAG